MLTRKCCCGGQSCCEVWLTDQFVTIFGELMDSAVPVSPGDLISLKINRPQSRTRSRELSYTTDPACTECCTPGALNACTTCTHTHNCISCSNGGSQCGVSENPAFANTYQISAIGGDRESCCSICGNC